jgi:hypothetical protein
MAVGHESLAQDLVANLGLPALRIGQEELLLARKLAPPAHSRGTGMARILEGRPPEGKRLELADISFRAVIALGSRRPMRRDSGAPSNKPVSASPSMPPPIRSDSVRPPRRNSVSPSSEPKVKGVAFRTIDFCFERLRGPEARDRARETMLPELADAFRYYTLLAASWYSISWYRETFRAFRAATGEGPELAREIGRLAARHDMSGVHKQILVKLTSPQALLSMSQRVFNTYYDIGRFEIVASERGYVQARCGNCVGWDRSMWMELLGSCESLLEIAGARNVEGRIVSGGLDGNTHAVMEATWE